MAGNEQLIAEVEEYIKKLSTDVRENVAKRPTIEKIAADQGMGRAMFNKLYRILYEAGPGNGTFLSLPFDQRVEHGVGHQFKWERSAQLESVIELSNRGIFSALVLSMGESEKVQNLISPKVPLIIKVDGHFYVGGGDLLDYDRQTNIGNVRRAYNAGADAVGLTFYVGNKQMVQEVERIQEIVDASHDLRLPVVIWAYARGPLPNSVGVDNLYWCHNAVSFAQTMGADIIKTKYPAPAKDIKLYEQMLFGEKGAEGFKKGEKGKAGFVEGKMKEGAWAYWALEQPADPEKGFSYEEHVRRMAVLMKAADRAIVVVSGGPKLGGDAKKELIDTTTAVMDAGAEGRIVGRNFWGRPIEETLELNKALADAMADPKYTRALKADRFTLDY